MRELLLCFSLFVASFSASADETVTDALIVRFYAQGVAESSAHLIATSKTVDASCNGRLYIDFPDKALFTVALAKHIAGTPVDIIYRPAGGDRNAFGHGTFHCRVLSIF